MPTVTKLCHFCDTDQPAEGFHGNRCKLCVALYWRNYRVTKGDAYREKHRDWQREYRRTNAARTRATQSRAWLKKMGMTPESFAALLTAQGDRCAICPADQPGGKGRWHIDHDHACCGKGQACPKCIRGLLCLACNVAIGYMGEDPVRLIAAAEYLIRSKEKRP